MVRNATLGLLSFGTATIPSVPLAVDFCELTRGRAFSAPPRLHRHMLLCCAHPRIARGNQQAGGEQQATHPPPFTAMFPLSSSIKSTPTPRPVLSTPSPDKLTLSSFRSVAASPHLGEILALPRTPYGTAPLALPAVDEAKTIARGVTLACSCQEQRKLEGTIKSALERGRLISAHARLQLDLECYRVRGPVGLRKEQIQKRNQQWLIWLFALTIFANESRHVGWADRASRCTTAQPFYRGQVYLRKRAPILRRRLVG
jgi:hypothetical protein